MNPQALFPRLPKDAQAAARGWENLHECDYIRSHFTQVATTTPDSMWVFDEVRESPEDPIYLSSSRFKFFFNPKRGLIQRAEGENTQGYSFDGKGAGTTELDGVKEHDGEWVKQFDAETERYFTASKVYQDLIRRAERETKDTEVLLAKAEATLKEIQATLTSPILEQVDDQLKNHKRHAKWISDNAKRLAEVVGKPAAPWETTDLDGKTHALESYRGKVVVLDFWYRGCGWCMRAMPQVKQLAEDFKKEPVAVLGMSVDSDEKDARFVVEKMKLVYPVLKVPQGLRAKYNVAAFPTLIIIDQAGTVHELHVGYSPTLRDDVAKSVKRLLGKE